MPFDGNTVYEKSLGGSESAAFYLARELARRGHRVSCWTGIQKDIAVEGVNYCSAGPISQEAPLGSRFENYASHTPIDLLIIQRVPYAFHKRWNAKVCLWQLHDLALYRSAAHMLNGLWQIDAVTTVSEWHAKQVKEVWNLSEDVLRIVPNGVDPDLYTVGTTGFVKTGEPVGISEFAGGFGMPAAQKMLNVPPAKFILLYQSRPERGLNHLVRPGGIMDRVRDLPVHLIVCGYDNTLPVVADMYRQLDEHAKALPNVTIIGALTKPQLAELQRKADLLLYPTEFDEVSCITAMEAMHAGLPMLSSDCGALPETCKDAGVTLIPLKDGKADEDAFVAQLLAYFGDAHKYPPELHEMREMQLAAALTRTWSVAADKLLSVAEECFARKVSGSAAPGRILRSAIERSDIHFAKWLYMRHVKADEVGVQFDQDAVATSAWGEINRLFGFAESPEAYAAHYAKHQGVYYDAHEEAVIGEDVTKTTRFRGVLQYVVQHCKQTQNIAPRVLDYGCAHGHYLMPFAKMFPNGRFTGLDVSARAIAAAKKWAERDGLENVYLYQGTQDWLAKEYPAEDCPNERFDIIIAGEVLEHVIDPWALLEQFKAALNPGGCLIISTPTGRWEHSGTEAFRTGREHMFHFERADIEDICAGHDVDISYAPAGHDRSEESLGSWVWAVWPTDKPFWRPNYERKLKYYAPRETISVCMIVKDGEKTLKSCVESMVDWVDEIVICVDPLTSDRTLDVCRQLSGDYPNRPFTYGIAEKSALRDGFDAARNESIDKASGDWILWCDADEEVKNPWNLHRLSRFSMHHGYGFAQVHYSADPEQVLTTDFPCRFFRNRRGIKFYGVIHEHPESELGKAVFNSLVRPEVKFLHCGYVDEEARRKRYQRNLPLLVRDREKYPTRELNKFLWLRDLAQGMMFEQEQMGGGVAPEHIERAKEGIKIMEDLVDTSPHIRMIKDAMPYYTHCVVTSGGGFESEITVKTANPQAPALAVSLSVSGVFHSRELYRKLANRFLEEPIKHYENRYL
jgi:glycosyltransferase involved in cell wall biosynthesis/2-polyprenyl-3-methyl-5-hydroxy-6-metoxy-1,4-benzoquinol methylase